MRTRRRLALIAGSIALVLVGLEVAARIYAEATDRTRGLSLDARLGWRPLPHIEKRGAWWGANLPARTNALGWRDRPRELAKQPGVRRALLLGDSYVFGAGVDDGLRISEALEREVPNLEAWNLGVTAYGPDQELLLLESVIDEYAPDFVVWFACVENDVEDVRHDRRYGHAKPWFELAGDELVPHFPEPSLLESLRDASYLVEAGTAPFDARRVAHRIATHWKGRDGADLFARIGARIQATARSHGALFVCVVIPTVPAARNAIAIQALQAREVDALELEQAFAQSTNRDLFLSDGHWNAAGHALAARTLADQIRTEEPRGAVRSRRIGLARLGNYEIQVTDSAFVRLKKDGVQKLGSEFRYQI